ncbi:group 1 truncated hemoglobin [Marinicella sp. S1101]|uniref:group I truncated hemoglobin n=1 Tax=Marinicella marina TaxID=2996016 RepID=UPI002260EBF9|nr:group 1 truncated hemoglobin [Marinicella marina]MCX7554285.1 group 1 truncated hemoglobin [Marinicella marina]MDJ1138724.1 group 1 truncated hemoglobin [Marinicella marina]
MKNLIFTLVITLSVFATTKAQAEESLYQQLGGEPTVDAITKNLIDRLLVNPKISFLFEETDREDLHLKIVDQICMETGGPCEYEGLDMVEAHSGMDIKYSEFDVFVEDFILAMEDAKVPFRLQNKVLAIFAPMREDVTYE